MKTKQLLLIFWVGGTLLIGCQKENIHGVSPVEPSVSEAKIKVRSRENVESVAADLLQSQSFKGTSISPMKKAITEISALTSDVLGDGIVKKDTLLFAVKNADLGRSVIVSANIACEPIIAILGRENISLDGLLLDTADLENPFMPILLSAMEYNKDPLSFDRYRAELALQEEMLLPDDPSPGGSGGPRRPKTLVEEVLPRVQVQWGQSQDPYNRYTPNHWPAGCVATAVAQALSVTKHLNSFNGIYLDWNNMVKMKNPSYVNQYSYEANAIGVFMRQIGYAVGMDYGSISKQCQYKECRKAVFSGRLNPYSINTNKGSIRSVLKAHPTNVTIISSRTKSRLGFLASKEERTTPTSRMVIRSIPMVRT